MANATERVEFRLRPDEKERLERAAQVVATNVSRFARRAIQELTDLVLTRHDSLTRVERPEFDRWRAKLGAPASPPTGLQQLAARFGALPAAEQQQLRAELFAPGRHRVDTFTSGTGSGRSAWDLEPGPVDVWLQDHEHHLLGLRAEGLARPSAATTVESCFVLSRNEWQYIEGFYTVRPHRLVWGDPPFEPGEEMTALLIGRLTVAEHYQREGLGGLLLVEALRRLLGASEVDGAQLVVVSAPTPLGRTFYEKYGFVPLSRGAHLAMTVDDARAALTS
ncbi:GNAT family N-acetyltransferase [Nocardioides speluncae]|uniref:GNAT family N-acetyltransferase n=1 Tax=Nocardioides speluncae TaxID=2670337 RepID=UPI000D69CAF8|nr:GNAT family N-acetyltransferase [Nocardioides speluncae]